jgi:hypothetical protein
VLALPFTAPMANDRAQAQIRAPTLLASWLRSLGRLGGSFAFQDKDLARLDVVFFKRLRERSRNRSGPSHLAFCSGPRQLRSADRKLAPRKLPANRGRRPGQVVWLGYSIHLPRSECAPGIAQFPPLPAATFKLTHCPPDPASRPAMPRSTAPAAVAERAVRRRTTSRDFRTHRRPKFDVVHCDNCSTFYFGVCHE